MPDINNHSNKVLKTGRPPMGVRIEQQQAAITTTTTSSTTSLQQEQEQQNAVSVEEKLSSLGIINEKNDSKTCTVRYVVDVAIKTTTTTDDDDDDDDDNDEQGNEENGQEQKQHRFDIPVEISLDEMKILDSNNNNNSSSTTTTSTDITTKQMHIMRKVMAIGAEEILNMYQQKGQQQQGQSKKKKKKKLKCNKIGCNNDAFVIFATVINKIDVNTGKCQYLHGLNGTPICNDSNCCQSLIRTINYKAKFALSQQQQQQQQKSLTRKTTTRPCTSNSNSSGNSTSNNNNMLNNNNNNNNLLYRSCTYCHTSKPMKELNKCSKCHIAFYCNKDCQIKHWKEEHKKTCVFFHNKNKKKTNNNNNNHQNNNNNNRSTTMTTTTKTKEIRHLDNLFC